jgi:hypothetical protein
LEARRIHLGKIGEALHHTEWVCMNPCFAIVKMLNQIIGCIPMNGFGAITSQGSRSDRKTFPA